MPKSHAPYPPAYRCCGPGEWPRRGIPAGRAHDFSASWNLLVSLSTKRTGLHSTGAGPVSRCPVRSGNLLLLAPGAPAASEHVGCAGVAGLVIGSNKGKAPVPAQRHGDTEGVIGNP